MLGGDPFIFKRRKNLIKNLSQDSESNFTSKTTILKFLKRA